MLRAINLWIKNVFLPFLHRVTIGQQLPMSGL